MKEILLASVSLECTNCNEKMDSGPVVQDDNREGIYTSFICPVCKYRVKVHTVSTMKMEI